MLTLGGFSGAAGRDGDQRLYRNRIEGDGLVQTRLGIAPDHFRYRRDDAARIAGIFPLGGECQMKVGSGMQAGSLLEDGAQIFVRGAGVSGRLEHDQHALAQMRGDRLAGFDDVGNIRLAILVQRSGHADDDRVDFANAGEIAARDKPSGIVFRGDRFALDVLDVAATAVERFDFGGIYVETDHGGAAMSELQRQR